jgi:hypothetical protein
VTPPPKKNENKKIKKTKTKKKKGYSSHAGAGNRTWICCIKYDVSLMITAMFHTPHPLSPPIYELG